jgi:hypothetical protein
MLVDRRPGRAHAARRALVLLGVVALTGCASSAALDAAGAGRLGELKTELAAEGAKGRLGAESRALAKALAAGEIARARGPEGAEVVRSFEACARPLEDALDRKADGDDEAAAAAAMILLEASLVGRSELREKASSTSAAWRAVGARALGRAMDAPRRRELLADPDTGVRLAALAASADAADPDEMDLLVDVARRDPSPLARTLAVRALARIGGDAVVTALGDLWPSADEPLREAITMAWSSPRARDAGGRAKLVATVERGKGTPAATAASILATDSGASPAERGQAGAALARAIAAGPARERVHAIGVAPEVPGVGEAVAKACDDPEPLVAVAALARRLEQPASASGLAEGSPARREAVAKLVAIAASPATAHALRARAALARLRAPEVAPWLERGLTSEDPRVREASAAAWVRFGRPARAAFLLADPDAHVRVATACALLAPR